MRTLPLFCLLLLCSLPTVASALTVTSISPAVAYADSTRTCDVYGTGFAGDAGVTLTPASGGASIAATKVERLDATHLRCTVTVPPGAVTGLYTVTVSNPKADSGSMANAFTVYARPTVTGMVPAALPPGSSFAGRIEGTGFVPGAEVFVRGGPGGSSLIFATGETTIGTTRIDCGFTVPFDAYPGPYDVYVRSHDDLPDLLAKTGAFTVELPEDTFITALSPASALPGQALSVDVTGSGFTNGAEVYVQGGPSGSLTMIPATGETFISSSTIRCSLAIPSDAYIGPYTVFLRNPGGEWVYKLDAFTVTAPTPTVTGISPGSGARGETLTNVLITGTGFTRGAQVTLYHASAPTSFDATDEVWISPTQIQCTLAIYPGMLPGLYKARVVNPGGTESSTYAGFGVYTPAPTVTGISPGNALPGQTLSTVYVYGTRFLTGAEVRIEGGAGGTTWISATGVTTINTTAIQCSLAIPADAYPGPYDVVVSNPNGGSPPVSSAPLADAFTVIAPTPTISTISPGVGWPGQTVTPFTVSGTGLANGAEVMVQGGIGGTTTIEATGETFVSLNLIQCTLAIPENAYPGFYDVSVRNIGGEWTTYPDLLYVTSDLPYVYCNSPESAAPGETLPSFYVGGSRFTNGAQVELVGGPANNYTISATDETFINSSMIRCSLTVPPDAYPGTYTVGIRVPSAPDKLFKGVPDTFTVTAPTTTVVAVPPSTLVPTDTDGNGKYEDVNGNGRPDFADVVLYFNQMSWIAANEPLSGFDYNGNGRIDFADVVWLFNNL